MEAEYLRENDAKIAHDPHCKRRPSVVTVPFPVIIGAGPSGLATAACLKARGVPSVVLERSNCIASLWQLKTYDRLKLHLPKEYCQLPMMNFPANFPNYPMKHQFVRYLEDYASRFGIRPVFDQRVVRAEFDEDLRIWRVTAEDTSSSSSTTEYRCRWLVVATGENAEAVMPDIAGMWEYKGGVVHTCRYRSGSVYAGKKVLVVGCGNSGMEVCLDLWSSETLYGLLVHILPREMFGKSTFGLSMWLLKWLPVRFVDRLLLVTSRLLLGDTARFGLNRPVLGPLEQKRLTGKTPVLDVGTLEKIKSGDIKVRPNIERLKNQLVEFVDETQESFDDIILATGYRSNVPSWLKNSNMFSNKNGLPKKSFPNGWKGENGLYSVGFTKQGLFGTSMDATNIANDIANILREESEAFTSISWSYSLQKTQ